MLDTPPPTHTHHHTLAHLRALIPQRGPDLTYRAALRIAERQAEELQQLHAAFDRPVPDSAITTVPHIHVEIVESPVSSLRFWEARQHRWIIQLAASDAESARRFHLAYEFKHILDYGRRHHLYRGDDDHTTSCQAEHAARHFAGCLLVPSVALTHAWVTGMRDTTALAGFFAVDPTVIEARLAQIGLGPTASAYPLGTPIGHIPHPHRKECQLLRPNPARIFDAGTYRRTSNAGPRSAQQMRAARTAGKSWSPTIRDAAPDRQHAEPLR
jgi:hypothetical protein